MKWILIVSFLVLNVFAESGLSDLPADVQKDIKTTEDVSENVKFVAAESKETVVEKSIETNLEKATVLKETANVDTTKAEQTANLGKKDASIKETEIPLSLETTKKVAAGESTYFRIIMVIALLGILACGTWIFVRKHKFQNIERNKNEIKILAQHYLGPKKSLAVVRVAGESILVGITEAQINMIKTLSLMDDELPDVTSQNFKSELDQRMDEAEEKVATSPKASSTYNRKSQIKSKVSSSEDEMDEFSIRGIKDLVSSKLKNMRSI
jgi:flagellar protein FliO/FliZ